MISLLCGALIGVYAIMEAVYAMLGYPTVRFRGTDLDADWRTAGALAGVAVVFLGLAWLMNRISRR
ncbi:MAG TPA: hypothetical protein VGX37_11420 [Allosphingosinicella sp.]|nr:hypothetical protein [Allosphingosinicella sp.]